MSTRFFYLLLLCIFVNCYSHAQTGIVGYEQYDSYQLYTSIDCMSPILIPDAFINHYYKELKMSDYRALQTINHQNNTREVRLQSSKAKSGFLYVNEYVMNALLDYETKNDSIKLIYAINNHPVCTKGDVMRTLRLKERRINQIIITKDREAEMVIVDIIYRPFIMR